MPEQILLDKLLSLYSQYASTYRSSVQPEKLKQAKNSKLDVIFEARIIRESLLEHVGHLPITAISVYPYLNDPDVDLGQALTMLAIHDIGELKMGDVAIFLKTDADYASEEEIALGMLDPKFHELYLDQLHQRTATGKFAHSIDKMVGDVLDLLVPKEISIERYAAMGVAREDIVLKKREKKMQYMTWNPFLKGFYEHTLSALDKYFD